MLERISVDIIELSVGLDEPIEMVQLSLRLGEVDNPTRTLPLFLTKDEALRLSNLLYLSQQEMK